MKLYGIDFTSAPRRKKPITCALGELERGALKLKQLETWENFVGFEEHLAVGETSVTAIDLPFGQPRQLIEALDWPRDWAHYVKRVASLTKIQFCEVIKRYRDQQPKGKKHHRRQTDQLAKAVSPMMLVGVPVGKMFYEGAPRLERSGVSILPCRPTDSKQIVIEGYPALVARRLTTYDQVVSLSVKSHYKSDGVIADISVEDSEQQMRTSMLESLQSESFIADYCFSVKIEKPLAALMIEDPTGDLLDALFCLIQAASWQCNPKILPCNADPLEGWIVDPLLEPFV